MICDEARAVSFVIRADQSGPIERLRPPDRVRVTCAYRGDRLIFPDADTLLQKDDEIVLVVHREALDDLTRQFGLLI